MARVYSNTFDGVTFTYHYELDPVIINISVITERLYIANLFNSIRDAECSEVGRVFPSLCKGDGRVTIQIDGDGEQETNLTVTLLNGALVNALKDSGKFYIKGGNLVPDFKSGYQEIVKENPALTYIVNLSQNGVITKVSTGSGLSSDEHEALMSGYNATDRTISLDTYTAVMALDSGKLSLADFKRYLLNKNPTNADSLNRVTEYLVGGDTTVTVTYAKVGESIKEIPSEEVV